MRIPSSEYRPFPVVRDVDCLISFAVLDQAAKKDNTVTSTNDTGALGGISATINDVSEMGGKYASLERNLWTLDGSFGILPDEGSNVETGWWSNAVSGADGTFTESPWIQYMFSNPISTLGLTLHFDDMANQYASRVKITCYDAAGDVADEWVTEMDEPIQGIQHYVGDYYGVRFTFLGTSEPFRRVRLCEVDFGMTKAYNRNSLGTVRITYGLDLLAASLPSRELAFTFDNSDKQYNLLNPDGVYQYLQDGQVISVKMRIGGEKVDMGSFYFTKADASRSAIVPEVVANDRVYILDNGTFDNGRAEDVTLSAAIGEALSGFDIPVRFDGDVGGRLVSMTISPNTKIRRAIQLLAQAARCTPYINRDGVMVFHDFITGGVPDAEEISDFFQRTSGSSVDMTQITSDELYDYTGVSIADLVQGVRLTVQDEYRIGKEGTPGRQVSYYSGSQEVAAAQVLFGNSCVADSCGQAVADWLLAGSAMRKRYKVKNRCDPAVELGDVVRIDDIFGNRENALITGLEVRYDGTLYAVTEGVGA